MGDDHRLTAMLGQVERTLHEIMIHLRDTNCHLDRLNQLLHIESVRKESE